MVYRNTGKFGKHHPRFKGKWTTYYDGYVKKYDRRGPFYQHRDEVEKAIKRKLSKKEFVHHMNFHKSDNLLNNLVVVSCGENVSLNSKIARRLCELVPQEIVQQITVEELGWDT